MFAAIVFSSECIESSEFQTVFWGGVADINPVNKYKGYLSVDVKMVFKGEMPIENMTLIYNNYLGNFKIPQKDSSYLFMLYGSNELSHCSMAIQLDSVNAVEYLK